MFLDLLHWYFKGKLEELSAIMAGELNEDYKSQCKDDMELDGKGRISSKSGQKDFNECYQLEKFSNIHKLVKNIGKVVLDLRSLGFTSMAEDAYASAIFSLLKVNLLLPYSHSWNPSLFSLLFIPFLYSFCIWHLCYRSLLHT